MYARERGFSLIELMIVVAIIAILSAIVFPSYRQYVLRSHRTEATSTLLRLAAEQEKFYIQNNRYGSYAEINSPNSEHGYYTIAVSVANATTFTSTATIAAGGAQVGDTKCNVFTVNAQGQHTSKDSANADSTSYCW